MSTTNRATAGPVLLGLAVVDTAVNLRPAVVGVSPLLSRIRGDLSLSPAVGGLVTTASVVCFGLLAPVAPVIARRIGLEAAIVAGLGVLAVGIAARLAPWIGLLFLGSLLAGAGIAVCNTLIPAVVKRDFPHRLGFVTGLYSGTLNLGAGVAAAVAVPLAVGLGSWRASLAVWLVPALLALVGWVALRRSWAGRPRSVDGPGPTSDLLRDRTAWLVTIYLAAQSFEFYAAAAWIPTLFADNGVSRTTAGLLLGWANVIGLVAAIAGPTLAGRRPTQGSAIAVVVVVYAASLVGMLVSPAGAPWVWMTLFGLAQGAGFAIGLLLIALRAPDVRVATRLSGMAQCVAYLVAATGPFVLGLVHGATHEWRWPMALLLLMLVPMLVAGVLAGRDRVVRGV